MDISSKLSAAFRESLLLWEAIKWCRFYCQLRFSGKYRYVFDLFCTVPAASGAWGLWNQRSHFILIVGFEAPKEVDVWVGTTSKVAMDTSFLMLEHCLAPTTLKAPAPKHIYDVMS